MTDILIFDELTSTNDEVLARAAAGAGDRLWVMARRQTAGRGRRQRQWVSEDGNLFATGLARLTAQEGPAVQLSLVAALAVHSTLQPHAAGATLVLRWPNDVYCNDGKIAGLLLESSALAGQDRWVVLGVGINLCNAPAGVERPATSLLDACGIRLAPEACLEALAAAFEVWRTLWREQGMAAIRTAWLDRCAGIGERILVRLPDESFSGRFADLDDDGALIVRLDSGGLRTVHAGDVFALPSEDLKPDASVH